MKRDSAGRAAVRTALCALLLTGCAHFTNREPTRSERLAYRAFNQCWQIGSNPTPGFWAHEENGRLYVGMYPATAAQRAAVAACMGQYATPPLVWENAPSTFGEPD